MCLFIFHVCYLVDCVVCVLCHSECDFSPSLSGIGFQSSLLCVFFSFLIQLQKYYISSSINNNIYAKQLFDSDDTAFYYILGALYGDIPPLI